MGEESRREALLNSRGYNFCASNFKLLHAKVFPLKVQALKIVKINNS